MTSKDELVKEEGAMGAVPVPRSRSALFTQKEEGAMGEPRFPQPHFRKEVPSDLNLLELYHQHTGWIPGRDNIRPTEREIEIKKRYLESVSEFYETNLDYVLIDLFQQSSKVNENGKLIASYQTSKPVSVARFLPNRFSYHLPEKTQHYIMWYRCPKSSLSSERVTEDITRSIKEIVKHNGFDFIWYENPKMTISDVYHVQVFWTLLPSMDP